MTNLILIYDPASQLLIPAVVAVVLFRKLVDSDVFETGRLRQLLAVRSFADPGSTRDDNVGFFSHCA